MEALKKSLEIIEQTKTFLLIKLKNSNDLNEKLLIIDIIKNLDGNIIINQK